MKAHTRYNTSAHPLLELKAIQFETVAFLNLVQMLTEWLWKGATGGFILGAPRIGKSWAMRLLSHQLKLRGGRSVPVFYMSIVDRDVKTIAEIHRRACIDQQLPVTKNANSDRLSQDFLTHVCDTQEEAKVRTAILIVDECDLLVPRQFSVFVEFFNKLELHGRNIMTVFVGNETESLELIRSMAGNRYKKVRSRFFKRVSKYHGIRNREELIYLMKQYDTLRYPENGPTYTAAFLPEAVNSGWRLTTLSKDLWRIFSDVAKDCNLDSWGLEYVVGTLNILVTDLLPRYGWEDVDDDLLREAVLLTDLADDFVESLAVKIAE